MTEAVLSSWNDVNGNLARDYIQGGSNFIWTAEQACSQVDPNSGDWLFKLEKPVTFLLGHACELLLKAGLAHAGVIEDKVDNKKMKHQHDLIILKNESLKYKIPLNTEFCSKVDTINENFVNFDYRYPRTFAGFPDSENTRITDLSIKKPMEKHTKDEQRKYGLVVWQRVDIMQFLKACQEQLPITVKLVG